MPVKTTKSNANIARATGRAGLLNKKAKFNWKIVVVIGVVLVATLGYLYVRLSKASTVAYKTWYVESFQSFGLGTPNVTPQAMDTVVGSYPPKGWLASNAGFKIPHANLGAGQYCIFGADFRRGGGEPVSTIKVYGINGTNRKLTNTSASNQQCVSVSNDTTQYPNREFEFTVAGGSAGIGSVSFIPAAAADGKGTFWLASQMSRYQNMYGVLRPLWAGALPRYESQVITSGGTAASPGGNYLYLSFNTDSTVAEQYCVEGFAEKGTNFAMDADQLGARDVTYQPVTNVEGGVQYRVCKTLTPKPGYGKVDLFMVNPSMTPASIIVEKAYRMAVPATGSKAKS